MLNPTRPADHRTTTDLSRDILTAAARLSGGPCQLVTRTLHTLLRVTVESTDESGGEYSRSASGLTDEGALRSLMGAMAACAAHEDSDPAPPALALVPHGDDGSWPSHAVEVLSQESGFTAEDLDGLFAAEMARALPGEWRVSA